MFFGRWDTKVDEKWRVYIPKNILDEFGGKILLKEDKHGCIIIKKPNFSKIKNYSNSFVEKIKNGGRIKIPEPLRNSTSFYFGKNITIISKGEYLKIIPRP